MTADSKFKPELNQGGFMIAHEQELNSETSLVQASVPVPLPTEVPPPPNLSQLPSHILHSGTVETLIGQNEDLMARLKVNIRRNSVLEQQLMEQDRINQELARINNSLVSQLQVFQEKDRLWREKSQGFDNQADMLRDEIMLLKERLSAAEERRDELHAGIRFEAAYRRRVRSWVRPLIDRMREEKAEMETRVRFLDRQLAAREAAVGDLREKLAETIAHLQEVSRMNQGDQALLVDRYEARIKEMDAELTQVRADLKLFRDKSQRLEEATSARADAENKIVFLERRNKELESGLGTELKGFQDQIVGFRKEAKALAAELASTQASLTQAVDTRNRAQEELTLLQDQFESLQAVWVEAQKKLEASRLSQESLNKLNQELSRQLKEERKRRESEGPTVSASNNKMERIDSLLAEIESGYTKAKTLEGQLNHLEIVEDEAEYSSRQNESSL